ncbi:MAG: hypothetical protein AMXMBFR53_29990 [Gemmatimonadota bacterium]
MTGDDVFDAGLAQGLVWQPALGMGFYPVRLEDEPYRNGHAQAYWNKYVEYARTPLGVALTEARVDLVRNWAGGPVVDVGIGCGAFIEAVYAAGGEAFGCDVSPVAMKWLHERGLWRSPWEGPVAAVTLWDVLEHLPDPAAMLSNVREWVFVSLPVFEDPAGLLTSKHFRSDEHRWYWSADGLVRWMGAQGFECAEHDERETVLGREDIHTFAFRRVA